MLSGRTPERRILALVLPSLACELARSPQRPAEPPAPLAVLIEPHPVATTSGGSTSKSWAEEGDRGAAEVGARTIDAVDAAAHALGVRVGQRVSEAAALTAGLLVVKIAARAIDAALASVAEVALAVGPTVAIGAPDTVWVDITGAAHLRGGEGALLGDLEARVRSLGHQVRGAIADGPRLAQAIARFTPRARAPRVAAPGRGGEAMAPLPVRSLFVPGEEEVVSLLVRLGVRTVAELVKLPPGAAAARLGGRAQDVLALARGRDDVPLDPYVPPSCIVEEAPLEEGVELASALVFVVRGLVSRAAARLAARGESTSRLDLELTYDRSIAALRSDARRGEPPRGLALAVDLPAPLVHEGDLLRATKAKLEPLTLEAPVVAVRLVLSRIGPSPEVQIGMGGGRALSGRAVDPDALPALLSELSAEIGAERVGVLAMRDDHRPEARTVLEPARLDDEQLDPAKAGARAARRAAREAKAARRAFGSRATDFDLDRLPSPLRLLPTPEAISGPGLRRAIARLEPGMTVTVRGRPFVVEHVAFDRRVDGARWWTESQASRDYLRVWLRDAAGVGSRARGALGAHGAIAPTWVEAWVYVDRRTGEALVQGLWE